MQNEGLKKFDRFAYVDAGEGEPILLLYGLFGGVDNYHQVIQKFSKTNRIIVPILPIHDLGMLVTVTSLSNFISDLINHLGIDHLHIVGNSLGGHIALLFTLNDPEKVLSLTLVGSSGLFENGMGDSYPRRKDYEYIKRKAEITFLNPCHATKELVDEIFATVNNKTKTLQILSLAKSTIKYNLREEIKAINCPTNIIWGKQDIVTPPEVAEEFHRLIPNSTLYWIDQCGHVPMIETPDIFNDLLESIILNFVEA